MRSITTIRLVLEPQISGHADEMFSVLSDPAIYEYENVPPKSVEWLRSRFEKLESRKSSDGTEQWLNWVIPLPTNELIGYVQATVKSDGSAFVGYELSSAFWGRGLASEAVGAMISELTAFYKVKSCLASFKKKNIRSLRLLERLGFVPGNAEQRAEYEVESDETLMQLTLVATAGRS